MKQESGRSEEVGEVAKNTMYRWLQMPQAKCRCRTILRMSARRHRYLFKEQVNAERTLRCHATPYLFQES